MPFLAFRRGSRALRLSYSDDQPRADLVWETDAMSNDLFSGVVLDGHVYGFDIHDPQTDSGGRTKGDFKCLDLRTGEERWSTSAIGAASVLTDGRHLLLFDERGNLVVAEATPDGYRELGRARIELEDVCWTVPSVHNQRLLVRGWDSCGLMLILRKSLWVIQVHRN